MHTLPKLPYEYNALEPYIDAKTMEIHHTKHHQTYLDNLNKILDKYPELQSRDLSDLLQNINDINLAPGDKQPFINHAGGHLNHSFFWTIMAPKKAIDGSLISSIKKEFGTVDEFKSQFKQSALTRFGSGWAWLAKDKKDKLLLYSTQNQDSPFLQGHIPLIGLDVWEHAYYLKYQNKRVDYIDNWWNVLKLI